MAIMSISHAWSYGCGKAVQLVILRCPDKPLIRDIFPLILELDQFQRKTNFYALARYYHTTQIYQDWAVNWNRLLGIRKFMISTNAQCWKFERTIEFDKHEKFKCRIVSILRKIGLRTLGDLRRPRTTFFKLVVHENKRFSS